MDTKHLTLSTLYSRLDPQRKLPEDSELRAPNERDGLRVKTSKSKFFSSERARTAHVRHAITQVRAALGESIRQKLNVGSANDVSARLGDIWSAVVKSENSITLRHVVALKQAVERMDAKSTAPSPRSASMAATSCDGGTPAHTRRSNLGALPAGELEHVQSGNSSDFLFLTPQVKTDQPAAVSDQGRVRVHPSPITASVSTTSGPKAQAEACLEKLYEKFNANTLSGFSPIEVDHFRGRLKDMVDFAAMHAPVMLGEQPRQLKSLIDAANKLKLNPSMPAEVAVFMESPSAIGGRVFNALSRTGKAYVQADQR
ncbi:MAG: hypothetical protein RIS88_811 [Pseudomonadota bacterium]|jgi:hypothetical protein